jgi:hypothetical protein
MKRMNPKFQLHSSSVKKTHTYNKHLKSLNGDV